MYTTLDVLAFSFASSFILVLAIAYVRRRPMMIKTEKHGWCSKLESTALY